MSPTYRLHVYYTCPGCRHVYELQRGEDIWRCPNCGIRALKGAA